MQSEEYRMQNGREARVRVFAIISILLIVAAGVSADTTIAQAKAAGPGWSGAINGYIAAVFPSYNSFVLESENRSAAIIIKPAFQNIQMGAGYMVWGSVQADGTFSSMVAMATYTDNIVAPLGLSNGTIATIPGAVGLNNSDLLVRTWGVVVGEPFKGADGSTRCYITDGSGPGISDYVQVIVPSNMSERLAGKSGDYLCLTGIAGKTTVNGTPVRTLTIASPINERQFCPRVVLAYDNTGDFGPNTPGTKTGGVQEAINYCIANGLDLYIKGGPAGGGAVYGILDTLKIPPAKNFRIDSGVCAFDTNITDDRDMIQIDSADNCQFNFGTIVYRGTGSVVRVKPTLPIPGDGRRGFFNSRISGASYADGYPFTAGPRQGIGGVVFDTGSAPITNNEFYVTAILNFATCVTTTGSYADFANNHFICPNLHTNAVDGVLFNMGERSRQNVIDVQIHMDQGATGVKGLLINGDDNTFEVKTTLGLAANGNIVFQPSAERNRVNLMTLESSPINQVFWTGNQLDIISLPVTTGTYTYQQRLYPATAWITGGSVSGVKIIRGGTEIDCDRPPANIMLSPGDQLQVTNTVAPTIKLAPVKLR